VLVLGIDPGSNTTGYGLVRRHRGRYHHVASGVIRTVRGAPFESRLLTIYQGLTAILEVHHPDEVAVEAIFRHKSSESALKLGHARGIALLVAAERALPVHPHGPTHVKKTVGGYGRATKDQVARGVSMLLGETIEGPEDATDALAIAITHLASSPSRNLVVSR